MRVKTCYNRGLTVTNRIIIVHSGQKCFFLWLIMDYIIAQWELRRDMSPIEPV